MLQMLCIAAYMYIGTYAKHIFKDIHMHIYLLLVNNIFL